MPESSIGSLCSGYGGLEIGLQAVIGGRVAWHVEYDKHPSAVLAARFPGVPNYGDVTTTDWSQVEPVDWLTAGYPCQPFSHAGKRKGSADERHLWPFVAAAIGALRPRRVLLENVAGHVSLGLDAVLWDLATLGYDATWGVVRAADAGAPHSRARIFIIAADADSGNRRGWTEAGRVQASSRPGDRAAVSDAGSGPLAGPTAAANTTGARRAGCQDAAAGRDDAGEGSRRAEPQRDGRARISWAITADPEGSVQPGWAEGADTAALVGAGAGASGGARAGSVAAGTDGLVGTAGVEWGPYEAAIRRWEQITGRPAPRPTEPGRTGERLSPRFVEWMQGLPDGWVTDVLPRNPALKALGNGVVPQQAALAVRTLLSLESRVAA